MAREEPVEGVAVAGSGALEQLKRRVGRDVSLRRRDVEVCVANQRLEDESRIGPATPANLVLGDDAGGAIEVDIAGDDGDHLVTELVDARQQQSTELDQRQLPGAQSHSENDRPQGRGCAPSQRELPDVVLGTIGFLRIALVSAFSDMYTEFWPLVALTVGIALVGIVLWGTLIGSLLPFLLRRLGFDPATSSAPFVATLVDVTGLVIYFTVAMVLLRGTLL